MLRTTAALYMRCSCDTSVQCGNTNYQLIQISSDELTEIYWFTGGLFELAAPLCIYDGGLFMGLLLQYLMH